MSTAGTTPHQLVPASRPALSRHVRLTFDQVRGTHVLLGPEAVVVLNATGAAILELCDGSRTVTEIVRELGRRYTGVGTGDVQPFLEHLVARRYVRI